MPQVIVLFICVHNAGRSQMAEAFVNHFARERNLDVLATSAGTEAGKALNPDAIEVMQELGVDMTAQTPKLLTQEMVDKADRVITMGCGVDASACPARVYVSEDWGLDDPKGQPLGKVRYIRDEIRMRVIALIEEIEKVDA